MSPTLSSPLVVYATALLLHVAMPARWVRGYVADPATGERYRYRLNGLAVLVGSVGLWTLACSRGLLAWDAFYVARWGMLGVACALGLAFTLAIVLPAPRVRTSLLADLYFGRRANPRWGDGRLDAKMALYLLGAVQLELNVLSFAAHERAMHPADPSPGVVLHAALFTFFVVDYLVFEEVHLYTYDLVAERVGFKLGWGCLVFYPFFYPVGLWSTAERPNPRAPLALLVAAAGIFVGGWILSRGANLQKFLFKTRPSAKLLGVLAPEVVSDGRRELLASGFWRIARHVSYLGEILMAVGLTLALGDPAAPWPWLYPLYYVALLVPRERDDDRRCREKYGSLWEAYCQRVPYRIVPGLY